MITRIQALAGLQPLGTATIDEWSSAINGIKWSLHLTAQKYLKQGYLEAVHREGLLYYALSAKGIDLLSSQPVPGQRALLEFDGGIVQTAIKRQPISIFHLGASTCTSHPSL